MNKSLVTLGVIIALSSSSVLAKKGRDKGKEGVLNLVSSQIIACAHKKTGKMRMVESPDQYKRKEYALSWNIAGVQGETGEQGATGSRGLTGVKGDTGEQGIADFEPLEILIEAPTDTSRDCEVVRITHTDNHGLFKVSSDNLSGAYGECSFPFDENGISVFGVLYEAEQEVVNESVILVPFGGEYVVRAHAVDLSGNAATATRTINSTVAISTGEYKLDEPLNETLSGSGCQLEYGYKPLKAETIYVSGRYKPNLNERCTSDYLYNHGTAEPENAVACVSVQVNGQGAGSVAGAITSIEDTAFSSSSRMSRGSGPRDSYWRYTHMDVEFFNTTPATVSIDLNP